MSAACCCRTAARCRRAYRCCCCCCLQSKSNRPRSEGGGAQLLAKSKSNRLRSEGGGTHLHTCTQSPSGTHRHKLESGDVPQKLAMCHKPARCHKPAIAIINSDALCIPHLSSDFISSAPPLSSQSISDVEYLRLAMCRKNWRCATNRRGATNRRLPSSIPMLYVSLTCRLILSL